MLGRKNCHSFKERKIWGKPEAGRVRKKLLGHSWAHQICYLSVADDRLCTDVRTFSKIGIGSCGTDGEFRRSLHATQITCRNGNWFECFEGGGKQQQQETDVHLRARWKTSSQSVSKLDWLLGLMQSSFSLFFLLGGSCWFVRGLLGSLSNISLWSKWFLTSWKLTNRLLWLALMTCCWWLDSCSASFCKLSRFSRWRFKCSWKALDTRPRVSVEDEALSSNWRRKYLLVSLKIEIYFFVGVCRENLFRFRRICIVTTDGTASRIQIRMGRSATAIVLVERHIQRRFFSFFLYFTECETDLYRREMETTKTFP